MGVLRSGLTVLCGTWLVGCGVGTFRDVSPATDENAADAEDSKVGPGPGADAPGADCASLGPRLIRRLTSQQLHNTLIDVFEDPNVPFEDVLIDPVIEGFRTNAHEAVIRDLGAQQLMTYAEKVAAWAVEKRLAILTTCSSKDATCRKQTVESLGRRMYREPLGDETVALYDALFESESTFEAGLEAVISAMLQSPYFLYRRELGRPSTTGHYVLTPYQIAESLSYLVTDRPPDEELRQAAVDGELDTAEGIDLHAKRLLRSEQARASRSAFLQGWLRLDKLANKAKDEARFPLPTELRAGMLEESASLFEHVLAEGLPTSELFSAAYTFVGPELGTFYGLPSTGQAGVQKAELTDSTRAPGLLGHAAFLATHALSDATSPVQRGVMIRERILCQDIPPPPTNVDTNLEPGTTVASNRERYAEHSKNAQCNSCHRLIDSIGFTLERYDTLGRYQEQENGKPIDDSGGITEGPGGDAELSGASGLMAYLADSQVVETCLLDHYAVYAYGAETWAGRDCAIEALEGDAKAQGGTLEAALLSTIHAAHFTTRAPDP